MPSAYYGIMKFEVKTQKDEFSKVSFSILLSFAFVSLISILSIISIKLGKISNHYDMNHLCTLLKIEKSSLNFKKLSKLTNLTSKQKMLDLCREFIR
ncbi:hypothetical protein OA503_06385 [Prochlorococcus sp. AH-716-K03]|nr:hypothetical protein [Prochlorococcus sp. AH-716-K03]